MTNSDIDPKPRTFGFLLVPGFALMSYSSAAEPLRAANVLAHRELYRWRHISTDGRGIPASNGISVTPDLSVGDEVDLDAVIVCAGGNPSQFVHAPTIRWLRGMARRGVRLGGVSGGAYVLARAGLLDGYRCTIHWEHAAAFEEEFPDLDVRHTLFEIDRDRLTCAGGTAALDMMHAVIEHEQGHDLAAEVSEWFLQTRVRLGSGSQRMDARERYGVTSQRLIRALDYMDSHIENPVRRAVLARIAGVSVRQLERLFSEQLQSTIADHYLKIRLERAHTLLRETALSLVEVGLAAGFVSPSHFSRSYRKRHGMAPSRARRDFKQ
ncbi:GlxA family transcriptional regulator [Flaviflagellibacter deserti]|uniref:GlxA family transcriptional regulator n=1 Tax=Flaviflagellibacter deserti TaxID=2267266 RepID=A0ABV9Z485_9HYPH